MQAIYVILLTFFICSVAVIVAYQICKISEECEKYRLREIRVHPVRHYRPQNRQQNIQQYIGEEKNNEHILSMRNCPD